jgi:DME family drug/metabolite transporter
MNKIKGSLAILGTAIAYGSYGVWAKLIGSEFEIFFQTYVRAIFAWLIVLGIVFYLKDWKKVKSFYDYKILFLIAFFGIFTQAIYYAYLKLGIGLASILYFFSILLIQFFIGYFIYKEKINLIKIFSVLFSCFGVYMIFKNEVHNFEFLAIVAGVLAGFAVGAQASITKLVSKKYSSWQISVFSWFGVIITCLPFSVYFGEVQHLPQLNLSWFYLFLFSILGLSIFPLLIYGYKKIDVSLGGLIGLVEIPAAILFGYIFFGENVTQNMIIGSIIILFSAAIPDIIDILKIDKSYAK